MKFEAIQHAKESAAIVDRLRSRYPADLQHAMKVEAPRTTWQLDLIRAAIPSGGKVMDVGGGIGLFAPALRDAGFTVTLVDDFLDPVNETHPIDTLWVHDGIAVWRCDASGEDFHPPVGAFDAVTCIHSIEHWHSSPKAALHRMVRALRPGGVLLLGVPNCVNARKRVTGLFGRNKWSPLEDWYERPVFRSHVREPDVDDLRYIARDLGLASWRVIGRNWEQGDGVLMSAIDWLLRFRPALCKDLYLLGQA